ncbi:hypothetical protein KCU91_g132, partial [Aureobasidium melanogenum]
LCLRVSFCVLHDFCLSKFDSVPERSVTLCSHFLHTPSEVLDDMCDGLRNDRCRVEAASENLIFNTRESVEPLDSTRYTGSGPSVPKACQVVSGCPRCF